MRTPRYFDTWRCDYRLTWQHTQGERNPKLMFLLCMPQSQMGEASGGTSPLILKWKMEVSSELHIPAALTQQSFNRRHGGP